MAKVDLSPKPSYDSTWAATRFKGLMNVIMAMNLINTDMVPWGGCESHYSLVACVAKVNLSPKPSYNPTWAATRFKGLMNVIMAMNLINTEMVPWGGRESHYSLVATINPIVYFWLHHSEHCTQKCSKQ